MDFRKYNAVDTRIFNIKVITLSDRCFKGIAEDKGGPLIAEEIGNLMKSKDCKFDITSTIIPDEPDLLRNRIIESVEENCDLIITTGSTGIGPRDIAPETIKQLLDKEIPGVMEMIRVKYGAEKPNALLSRSVAGIIGQTLIFALPGSPKAVKEYLFEINKVLFHCFEMIRGEDTH